MGQPEPLTGAKLRYARAQQHAAEIADLIASHEAQRHFAVSHKDPETGDEFLELPPTDTPQRDLRIRIGECVYNLRATLDYIVHVASGGERRSQFPLEDDPDKFRARITGIHPATGKKVVPFLKSVPTRNVCLIERVQPYKGVDWTRRLRDISNRDKHRKLVVLDATSGDILTRELVGALYPGAGLYPGEGLYPSAGYEQVEVKMPVQIAFPEGPPVREAIEELETQVGHVLADFVGTL